MTNMIYVKLQRKYVPNHFIFNLIAAGMWIPKMYVHII